MGINCAPLIADLFLFCYERDFMASLSYNKGAEIIRAFNSTSRYLDDLLNIDNSYFEDMMGRIYPPELQLNKANVSDAQAQSLDLHLSISNGMWDVIVLILDHCLSIYFLYPKFMISAMTLILT